MSDEPKPRTCPIDPRKLIPLLIEALGLTENVKSVSTIDIHVGWNEFPKVTISYKPHEKYAEPIAEAIAKARGESCPEP